MLFPHPFTSPTATGHGGVAMPGKCRKKCHPTPHPFCATMQLPFPQRSSIGREEVLTEKRKLFLSSLHGEKSEASFGGERASPPSPFPMKSDSVGEKFTRDVPMFPKIKNMEFCASNSHSLLFYAVQCRRILNLFLLESSLTRGTL